MKKGIQSLDPDPDPPRVSFGPPMNTLRNRAFLSPSLATVTTAFIITTVVRLALAASIATFTTYLTMHLHYMFNPYTAAVAIMSLHQ